MAGLSDTSPEAERLLREVQLRLPFSRRWRQMGEMYYLARLFHSAGFKERHPGATPEDIAADWRRETLGECDLPQGGLATVFTPNDNLNVVREVVGILDELGIAYAIGGSFASSIHGKRRFTNDADLCVEPFPGREREVVARFPAYFNASLVAVQDAVRLRRSFNLIDNRSSFKVDIFVRKDRPFDVSMMARRRLQTLDDPSNPQLQMVSAEDVILLKLEWYRLGDEISDRQWEDIQGVMKTQGDRLDRAYLEKWAPELGVADLLQRALQESAL